ncbi:hypothetical protein [Nocardioides plantarum]|uniref:Uncharacterized protein n=1 Tax=Nocardioides plantarum TaxID=29299 RepID=A0ABV5KH00_9ACTN|nr:hypothetical protein [Nocardioides plantarum]
MLGAHVVVSSGGEVLADRAAVRSSGRQALGRALVELAGSRAAGPGAGVTLGSGVDRLRRRPVLVGLS